VPGEGRSPNSPADEEHQLLLPMALAGGGEFTTMPVTQHFESHVAIIGKFLEQKVSMESVGDLVRVRLG
jgi:RNA 3'-terminal phosphate cyclase